MDCSCGAEFEAWLQSLSVGEVCVVIVVIWVLVLGIIGGFFTWFGPSTSDLRDRIEKLERKAGLR